MDRRRTRGTTLTKPTRITPDEIIDSLEREAWQRRGRAMRELAHANRVLNLCALARFEKLQLKLPGMETANG